MRRSALPRDLNGLLAAALVAAGCGSDPVRADQEVDASPVVDAPVPEADAALPEADAAPPAPDAGDGSETDALADSSASDGGALPSTITDDFRAWLAANGYGDDDFAREGTGGSFGGRAVPGAPVDAVPIVFVHGNSDSAIGRDAKFSGWNAARSFFHAKGWTDASLYATTWGPADADEASEQYHSAAYLRRTRRFLEAVLAYTGAPKIAVVAHSMGVTLARKAIEGGSAEDAAVGGAYDLGPGLGARIDTFVGIAGANRGLTACYAASTQPTCNKVNGFWPGAHAADAPSKLLAAMNATEHDEAEHVFSIWSSTDELIGFGGIVWGRPTSAIPGQDAEVRRDGLGHFALKDEALDVVWKLVTSHAP